MSEVKAPPAKAAVQPVRGPQASGERVTVPAEVRALLRQFVEADLPVTLKGRDFSPYTTSLWAEDGAREVIVFAADGSDPRVKQLIDSTSPVQAFGDLDGVKIQFRVRNLVQVHGLGASALNAAYPHELIRFQRRGGYRVQPLASAQPTARFLLPGRLDGKVRMRVLDVSHHGVALFWPGAVAPIGLHTVLSDVQLELDGQTRVRVRLKAVRQDAVPGTSPGWRVGFEIGAISPEHERSLQRYVDYTQKRQSLLSL